MSRCYVYLPFGHRDHPRVDVSLLERGEPELARRSCVRVRPCVENWYRQSLERFDGGLGPMVFGVVHQNNCVLAPLRPLLIQLQCQLSEVDVHHLAIGIGLQQREIHRAIAIES